MTQCPRCGKQNVDPIYPHTCTPLALTLADALEQRNYPTEHSPECKAAAELRRLHAENETLRADAERYRWLRNEAYQQKDGLDEAIDTAMQEKQS